MTDTETITKTELELPGPPLTHIGFVELPEGVFQRVGLSETSFAAMAGWRSKAEAKRDKPGSAFYFRTKWLSRIRSGEDHAGAERLTKQYADRAGLKYAGEVCVQSREEQQMNEAPEAAPLPSYLTDPFAGTAYPPDFTGDATDTPNLARLILKLEEAMDLLEDAAGTIGVGSYRIPDQIFYLAQMAQETADWWEHSAIYSYFDNEEDYKIHRRVQGATELLEHIARDCSVFGRPNHDFAYQNPEGLGVSILMKLDSPHEYDETLRGYANYLTEILKDRGLWDV